MNVLSCTAWENLKLIDCWRTPFLRVTQHIYPKKTLLQFLEPFLLSESPIVVQLMGNSAENLSETAYRFAELNSDEKVKNRIIGFDLNFACPSRIVVQNGSGGGLLQNPEKMVEIIKKIKEKLPSFFLEAKIRSGYENWLDSEKNIPSLCDCGIDALVVHFRTVLEGYLTIESRAMRMEKIVKLAGKIPVYGSGDVFTKNDISAFLNFGCAGALAGRGFLRDPFIMKKFYNEVKENFDGSNVIINELFAVAEKYSNRLNFGCFLEQLSWLLGSNHLKFRELVLLQKGMQRTDWQFLKNKFQEK